MDKENKNNWLGIIAIIGLVVVCIGLVASQNEENNALGKPTLAVSGTSELSVDPDQAIVYINILTEKQTAEETQSENKAISNDVIDALKAAGIKAEDIETSNYYLYKKYDWDYELNKNIDSGYALTHTLKVTTKDIQNVGSYIDKAIAAGANGVNNIEFSLTKEKEKEVRATAIAKATTAAKEKAENIAESADVKLENIMSISENSFGYVPYYANVRQYDMAGSGKMESTNIAPEKVDVSASVALTYEIESK